MNQQSAGIHNDSKSYLESYRTSISIQLHGAAILVSPVMIIIYVCQIIKSACKILNMITSYESVCPLQLIFMNYFDLYQREKLKKSDLSLKIVDRKKKSEENIKQIGSIGSQISHHHEDDVTTLL